MMLQENNEIKNNKSDVSESDITAPDNTASDDSKPYISEERLARRALRAKRKKRKKIINAILAWAMMFAIVFIVIFAGVKAVGFIKNLFKEDFEFSYTACENWPECESVSIVKRRYAIGIQYPVVNSKTDKAIKNDVDKLMEELLEEVKSFKNGKGEKRTVYTGSYSIVKNSDNYVSILFSIHRYSPLREINDVQYISKIYNIAEGKEVFAQDIFDGMYPSLASEYVKSVLENSNKYVAETTTTLFLENTKPTFENFSNIGFTDKTLKIYVSPGDIFPTDMGNVIVDIPLGKLYENMVLNVTNYTAPKYDATKPMIALTFDDGPYAPVTSRILDVLESVGGRATFFILGNRISDEKEMIIRGDSLGCEYGNHTWSHENLSLLSEAEILEQLNKTNDALSTVIGKKCALSRAPYAAINEKVSGVSETPFIGWTIDTMDWETRDVEYIKNEILTKAKDGDILLMHDLYANTAAAIESAIPALVEQGFQLVTVSELMEAKDISLVPGKVYHSGRK